VPETDANSAMTLRAAHHLIGLRGGFPKGWRQLRSVLRPINRVMAAVPFAAVLDQILSSTATESGVASSGDCTGTPVPFCVSVRLRSPWEPSSGGGGGGFGGGHDGGSQSLDIEMRKYIERIKRGECVPVVASGPTEVQQTADLINAWLTKEWAIGHQKTKTTLDAVVLGHCVQTVYVNTPRVLQRMVAEGYLVALTAESGDKALWLGSTPPPLTRDYPSQMAEQPVEDGTMFSAMRWTYDQIRNNRGRDSSFAGMLYSPDDVHRLLGLKIKVLVVCRPSWLRGLAPTIMVHPKLSTSFCNRAITKAMKTAEHRALRANASLVVETDPDVVQNAVAAVITHLCSQPTVAELADALLSACIQPVVHGDDANMDGLVHNLMNADILEDGSAKDAAPLDEAHGGGNRSTSEDQSVPRLSAIVDLQRLEKSAFATVAQIGAMMPFPLQAPPHRELKRPRVGPIG